MTYRKPSRIGKWILSYFLQRHNHDTITGDFEEYYYDKYDRYGYFFAYFWFWVQVAKSMPSFLKTSLHRSTNMIKSYLKVALRNMSRNKAYSFINISGLAIGMASFILIMLYVQFELSFDGFHENIDRIFKVYKEDPGNFYQGSNKFEITPAPLAPTMMEIYPEVVSAARVLTSSGVLLDYQGKKFIEDDLYWMDPEVFDIFTFPFIVGDPSTALNDPFSILLSESTVEKYFGNDDPINKVITVTHSKGIHDFKITGVFKDTPVNSTFRMNVIIPFETYPIMGGSNLARWDNNYYHTYFLLGEGYDYKEIEAKFPELIEQYAADVIYTYQGQRTQYFLTPMKDLRFSTGFNFEMGVRRDNKYNYLFIVLAFLILIVACINYMNLSTAKSVRRSKEVGIRKVVGARRKQLIRQFLSESVIFTLISLLLSVALVYVFLPLFNSLIGKQLELGIIKNTSFVLGVFATFIFVGLLAGSYSAFHTSSFKPASVIKGALAQNSKVSTLRSSLVVVQFSISIILIVSTFIIYTQMKFIKNTDVGYSRDQIVTVKLRDDQHRQKIEAVKEELKRNSNIINVATSSSLPNKVNSTGYANWPGRPRDEEWFIYRARVDYDFIDVYGINIVQGRNFTKEIPSDESGAFLLNEASVKALGWENAVGREFTHWGTETRKVVGIMKNFNHQSLHLQVEPLYFYLEPVISGDLSFLSVKIKAGAIPETLEFLKNTLDGFSTKFPLEYKFFDDIFNQNYKSDEQMGNIFSGFATLAIFIACLGLFGLASFTAEQRTKEIGVRKVLGASCQSIAVLLSKEFARWVIMANVIAWPISYYFMNKWLQNFAFRIDLDITLFLYAGAFTLGIAFITVSFQTIKAAIANPATSLRYE